MTILIAVIRFIVDIAVYVLCFRLLLQCVHAHYFNPISQMVLKVTDPCVKPLQRWLPGYRGIDLAIVGLLLAVQATGAMLLLDLLSPIGVTITGVLALTIGQIGSKILNIYFFSTILLAIVSWFPALGKSPVTEVAHRICSPLLSRIRTMLPAVSGIDFSPMVLFLFIVVLNSLIFNPLIASAFML